MKKEKQNNDKMFILGFNIGIKKAIVLLDNERSVEHETFINFFKQILEKELKE